MKALEKGDKGLAGTQTFLNWLPRDSAAPSPRKISKPSPPPKKKLFKMPTHDIEDLGKDMGKRLKAVEDEQELQGDRGFINYARAEISKRDAGERSHDFIEVYDHKEEKQVRTQASRCMDCGTPFCHQSVTTRSGCPLGNLIPEWNALVKAGDWHQAFQRLRSTNNFPEFTGRVCPAPCEASCVLGIIDEPVAIKSVELFIVDKAYKMGWMEPSPPPMRTGRNVAIVGSGPAGLAAADELNKMGHLVTVYERSDRPGGLMMYGVPNMKADKVNVVERRTKIMEKEGVVFISGKAGAVGKEGGPSAQDLIKNYDAVLLATGATIGRDMEQVPGRTLKGVHLAMEFLHSNTKAILDSGAVDATWRATSDANCKPPIDACGKHVVVIGGGDTGNDCIGTSVRHGAIGINNLELLPKPPPSRAENTPWPHWPNQYRSDYGHEEAAKLLNGGKDIRSFSVQTKEFIGDASGAVTAIKIVDLEWTHKDGRTQMSEVAGSERVLKADLVLLALGFLGAESPLAEQFGVKVERGNFKAAYAKEPKAFLTSNPKVFAAGDCRRGQSLVVWGIAEGREASKAIHAQIMAMGDESCPKSKEAENVEAKVKNTFDWSPKSQGLYDPAFESDACGVGMVADLTGNPSRRTVADCLQILENLDHRGARGCDEDTGDGAGILCSVPDKFFRRVFKDLPPLRKYAVGNVFFLSDTRARCDAKRVFEALKQEGLRIAEWRVVPTNNASLGATAKSFEPHIEQVLVVAEGDCEEDENKFMSALFMLRRTATWAIHKRLSQPVYVCSLSCRTVNYKGMLCCSQLINYFPDLQQEDFEAHVAIVHSRFSTNTFPSWQRAHPYRLLAHNGEINTIKGNTNWMKAREALISSPLIPRIEDTFPLFNDDQTDSSQLDNIMEVITLGGRSLVECAMLMVPQAWEKTPFVEPELRDFLKVQATVMEPWDGPALLCFTDSNTAGACLDRNGLRPCRYYITKDKRLICASEAGVLPNIKPTDIIKKGRLRPGHILSVDFKLQKVFYNEEIKQQLAAAQPYGKWIKEEGFTLDNVRMHAQRPAATFNWQPTPGLRVERHESEGPRQGDPSDQGLRAFGYTVEALEMLLVPMAKAASEAMGSMGNDTPLACLSDLPRPVYDFFYQRFAQVSNPPVDPIRESMVMSLSAWIGPEQNLLAPLSPEHCRRLWLEHPCLLPEDINAMYAINGFRGWKMHQIDTTFPVAEGTHGLQRHLVRVCSEACDAVRFGDCQILILSDRAVARDRAPLPSLMCAGAVHQSLVRARLRLRTAVVIDSGEPHEVAHHCLLVTFGADATCPYNAYESILKLVRDGILPSTTEAQQYFKNYQAAVGLGILKVMAKMGISTFQSFKGAQIAEPIGLDDSITSLCFTGSTSQVGGLSFDAIAERSLRLHARGFPLTMLPIHQLSNGLDNDGKYHLRSVGESELHLNDPMVIAKLQEASRTNSRAAYASFAAIHNKLVTKTNLRGLLDFRQPEEYDMKAIPLEEVEPASAIVKRFRTGAMSYGSISMEAHATLAIAMNRLGGKSNTGEGGEDPARFVVENGGSASSAIKQVASGRFGVTTEYLTNAKEIQIKMAQGAKPGEGGELAGGKIDAHIAECRNSTAGVGLVSPPPHHDIYSIEDLAQLINDLKSANPGASVSVKLVSEQGVGVVAAGVAKCKADHILISGCEGGTGASKWTGIKSAGAPWELGLAETHQTLVLNGLRGRVSLETDGQLRTGRDVVVAALLGAEHFGFATAPLIAMGCIMMRKCHLNTCPVGIATQDPVLRAKFEGEPEHVVNYLMLIAEEVRVLMSKLGFRTIDEMIGRTEAMTWNPTTFFEKPLVLNKLLTPAASLPDAGKIGKVENRKLYEQDHSNINTAGSVTHKLIAAFASTLEKGTPSTVEIKDVRNFERSVGSTLAHHIWKAWGGSLAVGSCHAKLEGTSGQSFGAFTCKGIYLELEGDSQDYFGKGLSGAALAVYPHKVALDAGFKSEENVIIGNVALYGATGGVAFVRGMCAERFAVRNSGAWAVVEGAGDHCCEYMTGGRVAVLGATGSNFAAGMSGGVAWVYDPKRKFEAQVNLELVQLSRMDIGKKHAAYPHDAEDLKALLEAHVLITGSDVTKSILASWPQVLPDFVRVFPTDFMKALEKGDKGLAGTQAFLNWLPRNSAITSPPKISKPSPPPKKKLFKMPTHDIEDLGKDMGKRLKAVEDEQELQGDRGFINYARAEISKRDAGERSHDFIEVYDHKEEKQVRTQASRCMDCGTPFCHQSVTTRSGCPLGNLIPEWNALVKAGDWHQAFQRLRQTNNFPEFTGRVCPAPCEASCVLGIIDEPVAIKSVELFIVDKAYKMGWMEPSPPPMRTGRNVAIVGSGPAGLAAADELNKMGHLVTVYERSDRPGGLMMYGVPNMKADKVNVVERRTKIMEKEGVVFICGKAGAVGKEGGPSAQDLIKNYDAVLLATGATIGRDMEQVPGRTLKGVHLAMEFLHSNTKAILDSGAVDATWRATSDANCKPPIDACGKHVIVIGGGDTGNDSIGTSVRHGAISIDNLELLPKPPPSRAENTPWPHWPNQYRSDYGHEEAAKLLNGGKDIRTFSVQTKEFIGDAFGAVTAIKIVDLEWTHKDGRTQMSEVAGSERVLKADLVLLALGFLGAESPLAEQFGVKVERGNFKAAYAKEPKAFLTSNPKVFAAGDCRRGQSLVVWGIAEGREAAKAIHTQIMGEKWRCRSSSTAKLQSSDFASVGGLRGALLKCRYIVSLGNSPQGDSLKSNGGVLLAAFSKDHSQRIATKSALHADHDFGMDSAAFCGGIGDFVVAESEDDSDSPCYDGVPAASSRGRAEKAPWERPRPAEKPLWRRITEHRFVRPILENPLVRALNTQHQGGSITATPLIIAVTMGFAWYIWKMFSDRD
ncbi:unnamed protein product [Polarella glacialis]|uniref:glutamate synthase (NADH) n=1 Tax=Polarella glacialis TaxID=89957 RepID=A0A813LIW0_POLGL|nr:unnamed protein product [Polarella glacialis]